MAARIPGMLNFQQPKGQRLRMVMTADEIYKIVRGIYQTLKKSKCSDSMLIIITLTEF